MTREALAIISGKGGVGKTSLAVALAQIIANSNSNVLVADFDFLNRGLSELVGGKGETLHAALELEISEGSVISRHRFRLCKVAPSIYCLLAPTMEVCQLQTLERLSRTELFTKLAALLNNACDVCSARAFIIDCHGSADVISRTAVAMCDDALVVCVPEVITFFGTKSILEDLSNDASISRDHPTRFHVVFNRVGQSFSTALLSQWSQKYFNRWTAEPAPIAVIPSDDTISIASVNQTFPQIAPLYSLGAEKLRVATATLFGRRAPYLVSAETRFVGRFLRPFYWARSVPFSTLLDPSIPTKTLVVTLAAMVSIFLVYAAFPHLFDVLHLKDRITIAETVTAVAAGYTVVLALVFWAIMAHATRSAVVFDNEISSTFRSGVTGLRSHLRILFCILAIVVGTVFMISLTSAADDQDLMTFGVATASLFPPGVMSAVVTWLRHVDLTVQWVSRFYLGAFTVVFAIRLLRSLLFRSISMETFMRIAFVAVWVFALREY